MVFECYFFWSILFYFDTISTSVLYGNQSQNRKCKRPRNLLRLSIDKRWIRQNKQTKTIQEKKKQKWFGVAEKIKVSVKHYENDLKEGGILNMLPNA